MSAVLRDSCHLPMYGLNSIGNVNPRASAGFSLRTVTCAATLPGAESDHAMSVAVNPSGV